MQETRVPKWRRQTVTPRLPFWPKYWQKPGRWGAGWMLAPANTAKHDTYYLGHFPFLFKWQRKTSNIKSVWASRVKHVSSKENENDPAVVIKCKSRSRFGSVPAEAWALCSNGLSRHNIWNNEFAWDENGRLSASLKWRYFVRCAWRCASNTLTRRIAAQDECYDCVKSNSTEKANRTCLHCNVRNCFMVSNPHELQ